MADDESPAKALLGVLCLVLCLAFIFGSAIMVAPR
jgi:hypothetical protein